MCEAQELAAASSAVCVTQMERGYYRAKLEDLWDLGSVELQHFLKDKSVPKCKCMSVNHLEVCIKR